MGGLAICRLCLRERTLVASAMFRVRLPMSRLTLAVAAPEIFRCSFEGRNIRLSKPGSTPGARNFWFVHAGTCTCCGAGARQS